jgi:hypothetical protein
MKTHGCGKRGSKLACHRRSTHSYLAATYFDSFDVKVIRWDLGLGPDWLSQTKDTARPRSVEANDGGVSLSVNFGAWNQEA